MRMLVDLHISSKSSPNLLTSLSCETLGIGMLLVPSVSSDRPFDIISIKSHLFPDLQFKSPVKKTSPFSEKKNISSSRV